MLEEKDKRIDSLQKGARMLTKLVKLGRMETQGNAGADRLRTTRRVFDQWRFMVKDYAVRVKKMEGMVKSVKKTRERALKQALQAVLKFK